VHARILALVLLIAPATMVAQAASTFDLLTRQVARRDSALLKAVGALIDSTTPSDSASRQRLTDILLSKTPQQSGTRDALGAVIPQGDPADSVYRAGAELFAWGEYQRAAEKFALLRRAYPKSAHFCNASYNEAFARYKLGSTDHLRTGKSVLLGMAGRCPDKSSKDVEELKLRIDGALAAKGDREAMRAVERAIAVQQTCNPEDRLVKLAALSALARTDAGVPTATLREVMATRDECSAPLRADAVALIARKESSVALPIIIDAAKNDPSHAVRGTAIDALATIPTAPAVVAIEDLLRTSTDVTLTRFAAGALARNRHPNAAVGVRALIQRRDAPTDVRIVAIRDLSTPATLRPTSASAVVGSSGSTRTAYTSLSHENPAPRATATAKQERLALTTDQRQYLMALMYDVDEGPEVRGAVFDRLDSELAVNEIIRFSKTTTATPLVRRVVDQLSARSRSDLAIDGMIEIMLNTNVALDVRRRSMSELQRYRTESKVKKAIDQFTLAMKRGS
jgi:hypothetical protein